MAKARNNKTLMYLCPSDQISRGNIDFDPSELHNMYNDDIL